MRNLVVRAKASGILVVARSQVGEEPLQLWFVISVGKPVIRRWIAKWAIATSVAKKVTWLRHVK